MCKAEKANVQRFCLINVLNHQKVLMDIIDRLIYQLIALFCFHATSS